MPPNAEEIQETTFCLSTAVNRCCLFLCSSHAGTCKNEMTGSYEEYIIK